MTMIDTAVLLYAVIVLVIGSLALLLKVMIFALAIDDWWELRELPDDNPERMVADDEAVASAGRVVSVTLTVLVGIVWTLTALDVLEANVLRFIIALALLMQVILAVVQGARSMFHRRALARVLNRRRRPTGPHVMPESHPEHGP